MDSSSAGTVPKLREKQKKKVTRRSAQVQEGQMRRETDLALNTVTGYLKRLEQPANVADL